MGGNFIPHITGRLSPNDNFPNLFALPVRLGGLVLPSQPSMLTEILMHYYGLQDLKIMCMKEIEYL